MSAVRPSSWHCRVSGDCHFIVTYRRCRWRHDHVVTAAGAARPAGPWMRASETRCAAGHLGAFVGHRSVSQHEFCPDGQHCCGSERGPQSCRICCPGSLPGSRFARVAPGPRLSGGTGHRGARAPPRRRVERARTRSPTSSAGGLLLRIGGLGPRAPGGPRGRWSGFLLSSARRALAIAMTSSEAPRSVGSK